MRKTKPLRKQRSEPQVSAVFRSVSTEIYANRIDPKNSLFRRMSELYQSVEEILPNNELHRIDHDLTVDGIIAPSI
jgi:hypothetical protein